MSDALAFHRNALQIFCRLPNILECYIVRDVRNADAWRDDEPDFSTFEFFVELYCVENLLTWKILRQTRGQPKSGNEINNCGALIRREPSSFYRDRARSDNSKAHCFSMQEFPVISGALDCVAN